MFEQNDNIDSTQLKRIKIERKQKSKSDLIIIMKINNFAIDRYKILKHCVIKSWQIP